MEIRWMADRGKFDQVVDASIPDLGDRSRVVFRALDTESLARKVASRWRCG